MSRKSDNEFELDRARRKQKALERLGTNNPRCIYCSEIRPECLELHHVGGRKNDPLTVIICRNCHRTLSDLQRDHPKQEQAPVDHLEAIGHFLLNLADFLALLIERLKEFGHELIQRARVTAVAGGAR